MDTRNQKKYEELQPALNDTFSNTAPKYPLACDPTKQCQNMNYKDYLNMTEGGATIC